MAGIGNIQNAALSPLAQFQANLLTTTSQLSTGKRITSAAVDPSGLAIAASLQSQVNGYDQASANIADAQNATDVAEGADATSSSILQTLNQLSIQASNDFLSPVQRSSLQTEADQLTQQLNTTASQVNFNGTVLNNGSLSGNTPGSAGSATVTNNSSLATGGNLAGTVTVNPAAVSETITLTVVNNGGVAAVQQTTTDTATGTVTTSGTLFAPGSSANASASASVQLGNFSLSDVGTSATVQVTGATAFAAGNTATVQTGPNQGDTTSFAFGNTTSSALGVSNIDLSSTANATNSQGQIAGALQSLDSSRAALGAQSVAAGFDIANNNIASVNLQSSESSIEDTNIGQTETQNQTNSIQSQISLDLLRNANTQAGFLSAILNQAA